VGDPTCTRLPLASKFESKLCFSPSGPDVFPPKPRGNRQIGAEAEFILAEETEIIIEGEALRIASISQGKNIANVKFASSLTIRSSESVGPVLTSSKTSLQVVVEGSARRNGDIQLRNLKVWCP